MKYELAKELKDAGFPQWRDNENCDDSWLCCIHRPKDEERDESAVFIPTLSELIEACVPQFRRLELQAVHIENEVWYAGAGSWSDAFGYEFAGRGSTASEAVARLWLALNKPTEGGEMG